LASIGSTIDEANAAAAARTTNVVAAADEVSAQIAALFGAHARSYQALSAQAAAFHAQFVQSLLAGGGSLRPNRGRQRPADPAVDSSMRPPWRYWIAR
jgi:hypothetical protein